jgi:tetratricopeptide (TPR) repeat protein
LKKLLLVTFLVLTLTACDSAEDRARKHFAEAQEYLEEGDAPRALVELRNAVEKDPDFIDARMLFAQVLIDQGRMQDGFNQYLQTAERYPDDKVVAQALARTAYDIKAYDRAEDLVDKARALDPGDLDMRALQVALDFRTASQMRKLDDMEATVAQAQELLAQKADLLPAHHVVVADAIRRDVPGHALDLIDAGLSFFPEDRELNQSRLAVLNRLNMKPEVEEQLIAMIDMYPGDEDLQNLLVQFYLSEGRREDAGDVLLARVDPESESPDARLLYLRFLQQVQSLEVMQAELETIFAMDPLPTDVASNVLAFRALKAQADFDTGAQDQAMAELSEAIGGITLDESDPRVSVLARQMNSAKVQLAQMQIRTGNAVAARALVEEVLVDDPAQAAALRTKAAWLLEDERVQEAIRSLREALANNPEDAKALTLMAQAYQMQGRDLLMAEMLGRAAEASDYAPEETMRQALYLNSKQDYLAAEDILIRALKQQPAHLGVLGLLGETHLAMKDWRRAQDDIQAIRRRVPDEAGQAVAQKLQAGILAGQQRTSQLTAYLDTLSLSGSAMLSSQAAGIREMLIAGNMEAALERVEGLIEINPDLPTAQLLLARIQLESGKTEEAEAVLMKLVTAHPDFEGGWSALYAFQVKQGDQQAADLTLAEARKNVPDSRSLDLALASRLEQLDQIDEAIAIYDTLYEANAGDIIVANNLASLLSTTRTDPESLEKAWNVARPLRRIPEAPMQDTYGWAALMRGEVTEAVGALEQAVKGLPDAPEVHYHLGRAYAAAGRTVDARETYVEVLELMQDEMRFDAELQSETEAALAELGDTEN